MIVYGLSLHETVLGHGIFCWRQTPVGYVRGFPDHVRLRGLRGRIGAITCAVIRTIGLIFTTYIYLVVYEHHSRFWQIFRTYSVRNTFSSQILFVSFFFSITWRKVSYYIKVKQYNVYWHINSKKSDRPAAVNTLHCHRHTPQSVNNIEFLIDYLDYILIGPRPAVSVQRNILYTPPIKTLLINHVTQLKKKVKDMKCSIT